MPLPPATVGSSFYFLTRGHLGIIPGTMKTKFFRSIALSLLVLFFAQSTWATCGGGGGGGGGGMSNSGGNGGGTAPATYPVPWKLRKPTDTPPPATGLVLYWFPASVDEI